MLKRFSRWLAWQIKYHEDKKRAPEILARIRRERGLSSQEDGSESSERRSENCVKASVSGLLLAEAAKTTVSTPLL